MAAVPPTQTEQAWLDSTRARLLHNDLANAERGLLAALAEYPNSTTLRRMLAGVYQQTGRAHEADTLFGNLLNQDHGDVATAFALAGSLTQQGRTAAVATVMRDCLAEDANRHDAELAIRAIELLDDCQRQTDAAAIAQSALVANPDDPRLHAYAGMLALQLGQFDSARQHSLFALEHDQRAWEWHVPIGLSAAQHYTDPAHPDISLFRRGLERENLSDLARAELHFARGKALDDLGDYATAAPAFRDGNALARRWMPWSRKAWRRALQARLAAKPCMHPLEPVAGFTPVFIVGMPRSGTTLLAELLSHHPRVCNRGELPWIAKLAEHFELNDNPDHAALQDAANTYVAHARQDDAPEARWFIDKQPLNFRYIDLMLALFPDARIIHCQRGARDTALSLWMQCFREPVQGYACDFDDIKVVIRDHARLMAHWQERYAGAIRSLRYEQLVASSQAAIAELTAWIGLPETIDTGEASRPAGSIDTASVWQARQPIHTHSVGRWQHYASYLPELMDFPSP